MRQRIRLFSSSWMPRRGIGTDTNNHHLESELRSNIALIQGVTAGMVARQKRHADLQSGGKTTIFGRLAPNKVELSDKKLLTHRSSASSGTRIVSINSATFFCPCSPLKMRNELIKGSFRYREVMLISCDWRCRSHSGFLAQRSVFSSSLNSRQGKSCPDSPNAGMILHSRS